MRAVYSIDAQQRAFRDAVNVEGVHKKLVARGKKPFQQLCASMDVLGDTDVAIGTYLSRRPKMGHGDLYLLTYGLLQVLVVQQDAICHVAESIGFKYKLPPELNAIRQIRNDAIGHPTKRGRSDTPKDRANTKHFGIVRITLSYETFQLYTFDWASNNMRTIRFVKLIEEQCRSLLPTLEAMTTHLDRLK